MCGAAQHNRVAVPLEARIEHLSDGAAEAHRIAGGEQAGDRLARQVRVADLDPGVAVAGEGQGGLAQGLALERQLAVAPSQLAGDRLGRDRVGLFGRAMHGVGQGEPRIGAERQGLAGAEQRRGRDTDQALADQQIDRVVGELADAEEAVLSLNAQLAEAKEAEASEARWAAQYKQQRDKAKEREEKLKTMLLDPTTVHINMMRGIIAKLDWPTLEHIHGNHPLRAQRDALLEALEELRDAPWLNLPGRAGEIVEAAIALAKGGGQ